MEDALKARLIGATVLVALAVLLIPELLSGRKPAEPVAAQAGAGRGTRTFTIELGGATGSPVATQVARSPAPTTTRRRRRPRCRSRPDRRPRSVAGAEASRRPD